MRQYTYASEYSVDEAVAANATNITFNQPVAQYNENFLNFPAGTIIPSGSYDKTTGIWMPSNNGLVVKILRITAGSADLDIDGSGNPASDSALAAIGINTAERQQLATLYQPGQSLWRVPLNHFSGWDSTGVLDHRRAQHRQANQTAAGSHPPPCGIHPQ